MSVDLDSVSSPEEQPEWLADSGGDNQPDDDGGGRLFLILAFGLAGLIVLGLVAVGGLLFVRRQQTALSIAQITPPAAEVTVQDVVPTPSPTATAIPATPIAIPTIAPTNTRVVQQLSQVEQAGAVTGGGDGGSGEADGQTANAGGGDDPTATPAPTNTPPGSTVVTPNEVPNTGFGGLELGLVAFGLVLVLFVSRRLRHAA